MMYGKSLSLLSTMLVLSACTTGLFQSELVPPSQETSAASMAQNKAVDSEQMPQFHTHAHLSNYTDWLANQLVMQTTMDLNTQHIAVLPFKFSQAPATDNHQLTTELSEHIAHDLQSFGVKLLAGPSTVLDNEQAIDKMRQTVNGPVTAYLTGTLIPTSHGIIVHAKLFDVSTNAMFSSAEKFIPFYALAQ